MVQDHPGSSNSIFAQKGNAEQLTLDELAERIRTHVSEIRKASLTVLDHVLDCGDDLNASQSRVSIPWIKWLRENCSMGKSTALLYQRLANHRDEIEAEMSRKPGLSIRAARRFITKTPAKSGTKTPAKSGAAGKPGIQTKKQPAKGQNCEPIDIDDDDDDEAEDENELGSNFRLSDSQRECLQRWVERLHAENRELKSELEEARAKAKAKPDAITTEAIAALGLSGLWQIMPPAWRSELMARARIGGSVEDAGEHEPFIKGSEILRRALSLIQVTSVATSNITPIVAASNEKEALTALRQLGVVLAGAGIDEITIMRRYAKERRCFTRKGANRRRRAA